MKKLLFFFFFLTGVFSINAQTDKGTLMKGYIISFDDDVVFSPTSDSTSVLSAFHDKSFMIGTLQFNDDHFFGAFKQVGQSIEVSLLDTNDKEYKKQIWYYFYCEVGFTFSINSKVDFEIREHPNYRLQVGEKKYDFWSIWIQNRLIYLKPSDKKINQQIKDYYVKKQLGFSNYVLE